MQTKRLAPILGNLSIFCSLSFWLLLVFRFVPWLHEIDVPLNHWITIWAIGFVLALIAATRGSGRWVYAALIPVANFLFAIWLIQTGEPR
jgi:hypothetical protein